MNQLDNKKTEPWKYIEIEASKLPAGPDKLRRVIDELDVENAPRYKARKGATFCNIFVSDVCDAMGFQPSHWVTKEGEQAGVGEGVELNANGMCRWFKAHGARHGWVEADRKTAMDAAARGHFVVAGWDSKTEKPGHVAVLLPEGTIAQAGRTNFVGKTIREGFGDLRPSFWIQARGGSHKP